MFENPSIVIIIAILVIPIMLIITRVAISDRKRKLLKLKTVKEDKQIAKLNLIWQDLSIRILDYMTFDVNIRSHDRHAIKSIIEKVQGGSDTKDQLEALFSYYGVAEHIAKIANYLIMSRIGGVRFKTIQDAIWHIRFYSSGSKQLPFILGKGLQSEFLGILNDIERGEIATDEQIERLAQIANTK